MVVGMNRHQSVIMSMITKSDDHAVGVRFVYCKYDYRPNWMTHSKVLLPINSKNYNFQEKNGQVMK